MWMRDSKELPPFEKISALFTEDKTVSRKKLKGTQCKEDSASGDESSGGESEVSEEEVPQQRGRSGAIKSGRFYKASSTRLVKQVLHAQSMLDDDELESNGDLTLEELPFHLLVAGEIEEIMTNISEDEKCTRLNLL